MGVEIERVPLVVMEHSPKLHPYSYGKDHQQLKTFLLHLIIMLRDLFSLKGSLLFS